MINETVIILAPSDYTEHRLSKYISYLETTLPCWNLYFYKPLQKIFSRVLLYDFTKRMTEIGVKGVNEEVIDLVKKEQPKYAIWLSALYEFQESTFDIIRKEGTILAGWFLDDEVRFDDYSKWWIPYLDYCVTDAIEAVPKYSELGARVILALPIMGGIPIDRDWSNIEERYDVSFVGDRKFDREQYVNEIKKRNIPIHVFGRGWGRYAPFAEMIDIFKTSKINLDFSKTFYNKLQFKGRIFEVCLAGGFLLTEYAPGIESYFDIDKEIVCFHNADEMIDKITYYLNHEEERRAIAQAGWKRATAEYTSFHVLSRVFDEMEKDTAARGREGSPHPQELLKMPMQMRKDFSNFHLYWAAGLSLANYKGLWKDALALSISYNPFNIRARLYYIIGFSPPFMRRALFKLYRALRYRLNPIPYLRKMKQSFTRRLSRARNS